MKSRFYLAFVLAGIAPVVGLAGFYLYSAMNQDVSSPKALPAATASVNVQQQQVEVQSISSSVLNAIKNTNVDAESLASNSSATALQNFVASHPGVAGVAIVNAAGKAALTVPATTSLIDPNYGSNPEFSKIQSKLAENGGKNYEFYTSHFGYPAFVFAVPLAKGTFAEVVLNISTFFKGTSAIGQYFILDGGSGHYLYHSDASKLNSDFNPQHESWLNTVLTDISAQKSGASAGTSSEAVYSYLGVGKFGVVHVFPLTVMASAPAAAVKNEPADISELLMTPMSLGFVLAFALLFIGAGIASRKLIAPFHRAVNVILAAADDSKTLTPEIVKSFGNDEAGQIIQALSLYNEKIQQSKNNEIRNMSDQMGGMQRQTRQYQAEAQEKAQQLADKLKEIEALKGMTEGLRNQNEQAKQEIGRVKGELAEAQTAQLELTGLQGRYAQLQTQLKVAEEKLVKASQAASTIQISAVRAAAIRTMSEELKNTLGIIKGYVSSVIGAGQGGVNEKQQEFLGMVINRSARLEKFINDLVDIYQVEIESKDAKMEEVNLASEIETFAFNFQTQTELKNLKFKVEAKPGLPKVPVVRRRMTQLWNVLYLQLIKDAPKGSTIPIVVEAVGDTVKVTVQDPGLMVAPESLPRMFDEFYDPKHPASPQLAGTGLKLALVKTILNAHGGNAVAEKADPGTRLILTFATKAKAAGTASVAPVAEVKTSPVISPILPAKPAEPKLDLDATFGVKPAAPSVSSAVPGTIPASPAIPPSPSITVGAKPPTVPGAPNVAPSALPPIPGLTIGAKPPAGSSIPTTPLPPMAGLTVGAKPPAGDGSTLPPLPPMAGLTVGAKPPSAGTAAPAAPGIPPKPVPVPGILDALISGKIPSVTAPAMKPAAPPAAPTPAPPPSVPKPAAPVPPPPGVPGAPKPMVSTSLEDLLKMKNPAPPKSGDDLLE
jgi:signal transduction histidine kinase